MTICKHHFAEGGRTSCLLQYVEVPILPHEQCDKSKLGKFFNKIFNVPFPKNRICAGSLEGQMDACQVRNIFPLFFITTLAG